MFLGSSEMNRFSKLSAASLHSVQVLKVTVFGSKMQEFILNQMNPAPSPKPKPLGGAESCVDCVTA